MSSTLNINPRALCVHNQYEHQARRTPAAPAVRFADHQLSFFELNTRANRLACQLQDCGVGPEVTVALLVERCLDLPVAILGILKAGGAYVPLDTDQPNQRLAIILDDCRPTALVTQSHRKLGPLADLARVVLVDRGIDSSSDPEQQNSEQQNPESSVRPDQLAYVLYTSGTTGKPKGVAVEHRQLANYLNAARETYGLSVSKSFAMAQTIAVDTCITSLFTPLVLGGCLHILSREMTLDPDALAAYCRQHPIDCLKIAPSHLEVLLDSSEAANLLPRKQLVLGGEAPSWELIDRILGLQGDCMIINEYGPTETTVGVIAARLDQDSVDRASSTPPIGLPIGNSEAYLLNDQFQPVGDGSAGELYIGGDQLARGYYRQPEPTEAAFVDVPQSTLPGSRLYRTGDLARRLPDGSLQYIGRVDRQIKIRGFRVEPAEIECVLSGHAAVSQSVVETYADSSGRTRLVAYVVLQTGKSVTAMRLIQFLRQRLPDQMVPATVILLDALPLLPQGKLDRKALPRPQDRRSRPADELRAPRTATEQAVHEIWQNVLGVAPIGVDEDFFSLGGDSLLASTLIVQLRSSLGRQLSIAKLFASPTIEDLAKSLDEGAATDAEDELLPITPAVRNGDSPMSFGQERIWFIQQTNPESIAYSYGVKLCFHGDLSVPALELSLSEELRRHEIYRTSFHDSPDGPIQRIHPPWPVKLPLVNVGDVPEQQRGAEAERQLDRLLKQPFDLADPPLVRWVLIRIDARNHWLLHVENHLVHDGWSSDLFFQEVLDLYNAFRCDQLSPLADPPLQYADFAHWEKEWIDGPRAAQQREFWRRTLANSQTLLRLPADRPRPKLPTYRGGRHDTEVSTELWNQLCVLARGERATPFMVMLAAFYALLHHYTGQTDINLGSGVANRRRPEVAGVLGMFINNLVLRMDVSGNPTFRTLIARAREVCLKAFDNQELPFNAVVQCVAEQQREIDRNPLYQTMFSFHDTPMPDINVHGLEVVYKPSLDNGTSKFDLSVIVYPALIRDVDVNLPATDNQTWLIWEYSTDLFDAETIEGLAGSYQQLILQVTANPDATMSQLTPISPQQQRQSLLDWNDTAKQYPCDKRVHQLFEQQARRTPNAVAVVFQDRHLTFRELNEHSNRLAHFLCQAGVDRESVVGLCVDRSIELVIGVFGILKAGGAYLPMVSDDPPQRLEWMLADADADFLVTQQSILSQISRLPCQAICLDKDSAMIDSQSTGNPAIRVGTDDLAYVIYTSGSTGDPKGTLVEHRAIANHMAWMLDTFPLTAEDNVLQKTPICFDASIWEFFAPLLSGARLTMSSPGVHRDPASMVRTISDNGVTVFQVVPTLLRTLLEEPDFADLDSLRLLFSGGEELLERDQIRLFQQLPNVQLTNLYGPTETCIDSVFWRCDPTVSGGRIPIGRPIANTQVYVLDQHRQPVPIGVIGELYIGGAGLARGYLNRPHLTAEKFVPNPFDDGPDSRLYRTGDQCRWRNDGMLEFAGRLDDQVKLRGFRIELGEIESALNEHPDVTCSVVTLREDHPGDQRLICHCVPASGANLDSSALASYLRTKLPPYMVPATFMSLESLPLTPGGKLDRKSLPAPEANRSATTAQFVAPQTPIEQLLAEIWREVLSLEQVGIHDNFFQLGGHSLSALRVLARIERQCGVRIPISSIFEGPTIALFADRLLKEILKNEASANDGASQAAVDSQQPRSR